MVATVGPDQQAGREGPDPTHLYARLLGEAWPRLPALIRRLHSVEGKTTAAGRARVERGAGPLARLIGWFAGFPPAHDDVAVHVTFERRGDIEIWRRDLGGHVFQSTQEAGGGCQLVERFGPAAFSMTLIRDGERLGLRLLGWRLFGLPMPRWTAPVSTAWEGVEDGRFRFFVEISHPLLGLIVRYQGWLAVP